MSPTIQRLVALVQDIREREGWFTDIVTGSTRVRNDSSGFLSMMDDLGWAARLSNGGAFDRDAMSQHVAACALRIADYAAMPGFDLADMADRLHRDRIPYGAANGQPLDATRWLAVMLHITDAIFANRTGATSRYPGRLGVEEHLAQALRALVIIGAITGRAVDKTAASMLAPRLNKELTNAEG